MSGGRQILEIANGDRTVWLIIRLFGSPEHLQFTSASTIGSTSFGVVPSSPRLLRFIFVPFHSLSLASLAFALSRFFSPFFILFLPSPLRSSNAAISSTDKSWDDSAFPLSRNCCHPAWWGHESSTGILFLVDHRHSDTLRERIAKNKNFIFRTRREIGEVVRTRNSIDRGINRGTVSFRNYYGKLGRICKLQAFLSLDPTHEFSDYRPSFRSRTDSAA